MKVFLNHSENWDKCMLRKISLMYNKNIVGYHEMMKIFSEKGHIGIIQSILASSSGVAVSSPSPSHSPHIGEVKEFLERHS